MAALPVQAIYAPRKLATNYMIFTSRMQNRRRRFNPPSSNARLKASAPSFRQQQCGRDNLAISRHRKDADRLAERNRRAIVPTRAANSAPIARPTLKQKPMPEPRTPVGYSSLKNAPMRCICPTRRSRVAPQGKAVPNH
jgi:hypothetical protein